MTAIEIVLLIVGMLFILGSFWATEKLSPEETERISELGKAEVDAMVNDMLERELEASRRRVAELVEDTIDASKERTERSLEKQTNEKIMAINEYSDTVIEKMNKTHNEIMFLYSMLNDKHAELTNFSSGISEQLADLKAQEEELTNYYLDQLKQQRPQYVVKPAEPASVPQEPDVKPAEEQAYSGNSPLSQMQTEADMASEPEAPAEPAEEEVNVRDEIIRLYEEGRDSVAIAKKLGMGVGEVRLILGLYKGDN